MGELIPHEPVSRLSLEELWAMADRIGRLRIGTFGADKQAELRINAGGDSLYIKSRETSDLKANLAEVIERAQAVKDFYRQAGYLE